MKRKLLLNKISNRRGFSLCRSMILLAFMMFVGESIYANDVSPNDVNGGTLSEDDYSFCVGDGEADHVSKVSAENTVGPNMQWVVTSPEGEILGLPPTPEAVNFDGAGPGTCLIWNLAYLDGLQGLAVGNNANTDLVGIYDFSDDYVTVTRSQPEAGELVGGPFEFIVDGEVDNVYGIKLMGVCTGSNSTYIITSPEGEILGIPKTLQAVEGVNFDGAGAGTCLIWNLRYEDGLTGLEKGMNANDLMGCFDLSNYIEVVRTDAVAVDGGTLSEDDYSFCVGDGEADHVSNVSAENTVGPNMQWVVTSPTGEILGLPPTAEAVNFDGAGAGTCLIWNLAYADGLEGLEVGNNALTDLVGTYDLSDDYVTVTRSQPEAGELVGGPFEFVIDEEIDNVSGIKLNGDRSGTNSTWVITDDQGKILGLPPTLDAVEGVNFNEAGAGTCLIWYLRYEDGLEGAEMGMNANNLMGCYDLSNPITVVRTEPDVIVGGEIVGGPFEFCVGDDEVDNVSGVEVIGNEGSNSQWVITDSFGKILGLPPTPEAVNFDGAGPGLCLIWHLSYADGLVGLEAGNNVAELNGNYEFSNEIEVNRFQPEAGELVGGPFAFDVDGVVDNVYGIKLKGDRSGSNSTYVITTPEGKILGLPPTIEAVEGVNFDGAGAGTCLIWYLRYEDGLQGAEMGMNANDLMGCFDLSNYIEVVRTDAVAVDGGTLSEDDFSFCVGDGEADHVSNVSAENTVGPNMQWVVTSPTGEILGLPPTAEAVNFDGAGAGTCLIWNLAYADGLEGLEVGNNALTDLVGTYDLSDDYVTVTRSQPEAGELVGGPFEFVIDEEIDNVSGIKLNGDRSGTNSTWVITDDQGKILGLPPTLDAVEGVNFNEAGAGTCLIWYLRYEDGLEGAEMGMNANNLMGCYDLSNPITVVRTEPDVIVGGEIVGGPFEFCVGDDEVDNVSGVEVIGNEGSNSQWVITDSFGKILGLPPTPEAVNFDGAGPGLCLIWHLSYADGLVGLEAGNNVAELNGNYEFSNEIEVNRFQPEAGELVGGPFAFDVDGVVDNVYGIKLKGDRSGSNSTYVITTPEGKILGLPPTIEAVEGVNFDGAGAGTCLIWYLRYEDGLQGAEMGMNANDLMGCFDLSNYIEVVRTDAVAVDGGTLSEDDFSFCVGDGEADHVSNVSAENTVGPNMQWVVTSPTGEILGLPPTAEAVNFDGAGAGTCLIWNLAYADGLEGLEVGNNALTDLVGTYDLSDDYVTVTRSQPEAGELVGGPFEFVVDGEVDNVSGIELTGDRSGTNSTFVITTPEGKILGIPPTMDAVEGVNFDGAGAGTCLIWYLRYEDGLVGLEPDLNANDLMGCFDLSNAIEVVRADETSISGKSSSATVFPLPASDVLNVSLHSFGKSDVHVTMVDLAGNSIKSNTKKVVNKGISLDVQSVPSGLYILNIINGEGKSVSKKVIIR